jgi:hypothetical protein
MNALSFRSSANLLRFAALLACLALPACGGGGGSGPSGSGSGFASLNIENAFWGRLVDVFDESGILVEEDVLVREGLSTDDVDYILSLNPVTQREILTVLAPYTDSLGRVTPRFESLLDSARTGLASLGTKGWVANGTYTRVARNGGIRLEFSEFLDPSTVNRLTIQVVINGRIADVRYIVKEGKGSDGKPRGVVLIDPTITPQDSADLLVGENGVGFEASTDSVQPNAAIRIPTAREPLYGQTQILSNRAGNRTLALTASDPTELSAGLSPVALRVFRTGNSSDPANGFMKDEQRPNLQADLAADILAAIDLGELVELTYRVRAVRCRPITPKVGDVLTIEDGAIVLVSQIVSAANRDEVVVQGALINGDLSFGDFSALPLDANLTSFYTQVDIDYQLCWVRFDPEPVSLPATGVDPFSTVSIRFSEPIDPDTVRSLSSFVLHSYDDDANFEDGDRNAGFQLGLESVSAFIDRLLGYTVEDNPDTPTIENGSGRMMLGPISVTADSRTFSLAPSAGLTDSFNEGLADLNIAIALGDRQEGILDLAGNPLGFGDFVAGSDGQVEVVSVVNPPSDRYFALRLNSLDENDDAFSEYVGQFAFTPGVMRGRDLVRFSRQADPSANSFVGQRAAFLQAGVATPLNPAGAVLMTCFGYHLLGFGVTAPGEYNLDVEGLSWAPFGGTVLDDVYDRYSVALGHSNRYPDDYINPTTGYPDWPNSGLRKNAEFDLNIIGFQSGVSDEQIMFDRAYFLNGADTYIADSGVIYAPWPEFDDTYTWRDNSLPGDATGGPNQTYGVPIAATEQDRIYKAAEWPSVVAPLLVRFRCYPRGDFVGFNGFQVQIMVPSSNVPSYRVFSYGGNGGDLVVPDVPQSGTEPTGGVATGGGTQRGFGPELYWSNIDFVVRVSRVFTHIFALGGTFDGVGTQVLEPVAQPDGTDLTVEWRGYEVVDLSGCTSADDITPLRDAPSQFDGYGNFIGLPISQDRLVNPPIYQTDYCATVSDPSPWTMDVDSLAAETKWKYFQLRITFVSNTEKDLSPTLDAYGFSWTVQ